MIFAKMATGNSGPLPVAPHVNAMIMDRYLQSATRLLGNVNVCLDMLDGIVSDASMDISERNQ